MQMRYSEQYCTLNLLTYLKNQHKSYLNTNSATRYVLIAFKCIQTFTKEGYSISTNKNIILLLWYSQITQMSSI